MLEFASEQLGGVPAFMCESDPFCQRVLRRRFPGVPLIEDVSEVRGDDWNGIDVLVGGFPCQDISSAGRGGGIKGSRSGLWKQFFRVISEMRPKLVLIENVAVLKSRGLDVVLCDLWSIGYHAEWDTISAASVGAPHLRERIWICARPSELAGIPIYGEPARDRKGEIKTFSMAGKLPRAGRMGEELHELVPTAPRKTKRKDGWSHWIGVNLLGGDSTRLLWPSSSSSQDYKDTGDLNCVPENSLLPRRVEQGTALVPTPCANDDNKSPEAHMEMKQTKMPGGPRNTITSLQVLAKNDMRQANGHLWPTTTTTDAKAARNETAGRTDPNSKHHSGRTLLDAIIVDGDPSRVEGTVDGASRSNSVIEIIRSRGIKEPFGLSTPVVSETSGRSRPCWPTPSAASGSQGPGTSGREGGENLVTRVNGSLNPSWEEWLMGMPLWWTDPTVPNEFTTLIPWDQEPFHIAPRVVKGIPLRAKRVHAIGNSVVWPCAFYVLSRALSATPQIVREEATLPLAA